MNKTRDSRRILAILLLTTAPLMLSGCAALGVLAPIAQGIVAVLGVVRAVGAVTQAPLAGPVQASFVQPPLAPAPSATPVPATAGAPIPAPAASAPLPPAAAPTSIPQLNP